jgi:hypothetical protein
MPAASLTLSEGLELAVQELGRLGVRVRGHEDLDGHPGVETRPGEPFGNVYRSDPETFQDEGSALKWATVVATLHLGVRA